MDAVSPVIDSRAGFLGALEALREQGALDAREEADLIRQFDDTFDEFQRVREHLLSEYERRTDEHGREAADSWLAEAAQVLGRDQGERLSRLFGSIPSLAGLDA